MYWFMLQTQWKKNAHIKSFWLYRLTTGDQLSSIKKQIDREKILYYGLYDVITEMYIKYHIKVG